MKKWTSKVDGTYDLYNNEEHTATLTINHSKGSANAVATIDGKAFSIFKKGFWSPEIIITDAGGSEVLTAIPTKWHAGKYDVIFQGKALELNVRNNPLAEWVLSDADALILAYGLDTTGKNIAIKIKDESNSHPLHDILLWYLFMPIALEQSVAQDISFN